MNQQHIVMVCAPAKSGKDALFPIMQRDLTKQFGGTWVRYAFADILKKELEHTIKRKYGVSVWDDSKKHIFRTDLIKYGEEKRNETDGMFLIDRFINEQSPNINYIITDYRFSNEYYSLKRYFEPSSKIHPVYIERTLTIGRLKFATLPSISQEIEQYPFIKEDAKLCQIPWECGLLWKSRLRKYKFKL